MTDSARSLQNVRLGRESLCFERQLLRTAKSKPKGSFPRRLQVSEVNVTSAGRWNCWVGQEMGLDAGHDTGDTDRAVPAGTSASDNQRRDDLVQEQSGLRFVQSKRAL